jgi:hypothetical protein
MKGWGKVKLGIMQPYLFPYIGYWQLMNAVDKFVVYDDVTYIKGGWINRNYLLVSGQKKLFTISLSGASSYKLINEIEILDDFSRLMKTIQTNYARAPNFNQVKGLVEEIINFESRNLSEFIINSFRVIFDYLDIKTKLLVSSSLNLGIGLKGKDRVINMCESLGATDYYNSIGGQSLYDKEEFLLHGISLHFLKANLERYDQGLKEFIPGLSILDVLMFNSPQKTKEMLYDYELV